MNLVFGYIVRAQHSPDTLGLGPEFEAVARMWRPELRTPSQALAENREAIRLIVARHRALNPRVFGSVLDGSDTAVDCCRSR